MRSNSSADSLFGGALSGLFAHQVVKVLAPLVGWTLAVILATQIADPDTNGIAVLLRWLTVSAFIASMISPKVGIYLVLLACPVLDLVKRLLILYDTVNMIDVSSVLAYAPVVMGGAILGTFSSRLMFRKKLFERGEGMLFVTMTGIFVCVAISSVLHVSDSKLLLLKSLGETCIYLSLIFLVSVHFKGQEEIVKLLRLCVMLFVPVALYGFWQHFFGLADFEERYLLSGLTITTEDFLGSGRIFSTLNSNHSFSVTMACCAVLALLQRYAPAPAGWQKNVRGGGWLLFVLFSAACFISLRRTGWLVLVVALVGALCFGSRKRTYTFYTVCVGVGGLIVLSANYLLEVIADWDSLVQSIFPNSFEELHLQTFNDRLYSFVNLTSAPGMWSFFGLSDTERGWYYVHDAISEALVSYGAIPLFFFIGILIYTLRLSHRLVWREHDPAKRRYIAMLLSLVFANLFIGAMMQSHIGIFPINFIFWFCVGALLKVVFQENPTRHAPLPEPLLPHPHQPTIGARGGLLSYNH